MRGWGQTETLLMCGVWALPLWSAIGGRAVTCGAGSGCLSLPRWGCPVACSWRLPSSFTASTGCRHQLLLSQICCLHHFCQLPVNDAEVQCCLIGPACLCCLLPAAGVGAETDCCPLRLQKESCPLSPLARAATARWRGCCVELQRKLPLHCVSKNAEKRGRKLTTQDLKTGKASCLSGCKP